MGTANRRHSRHRRLRLEGLESRQVLALLGSTPLLAALAPAAIPHSSQPALSGVLDSVGALVSPVAAAHSTSLLSPPPSQSPSAAAPLPQTHGPVHNLVPLVGSLLPATNILQPVVKLGSALPVPLDVSLGVQVGLLGTAVKLYAAIDLGAGHPLSVTTALTVAGGPVGPLSLAINPTTPATGLAVTIPLIGGSHSATPAAPVSQDKPPAADRGTVPAPTVGTIFSSRPAPSEGISSPASAPTPAAPTVFPTAPAHTPGQPIKSNENGTAQPVAPAVVANSVMPANADAKNAIIVSGVANAANPTPLDQAPTFPPTQPVEVSTLPATAGGPVANLPVLVATASTQPPPTNAPVAALLVTLIQPGLVVDIPGNAMPVIDAVASSEVIAASTAAPVTASGNEVGPESATIVAEPHGVGAVTGMVPFGVGSLDREMQQVLDGILALGQDLNGNIMAFGLKHLLMALLAVALGGVEITRRQLQPRRQERGDDLLTTDPRFPVEIP